ncbi:MAG: CocE/NonD family hydrolase [Flavipsychrobacter sp.]|nr:CocE/NonD family hydrolase [Flavipsychrobacter sp.]
MKKVLWLVLLCSPMVLSARDKRTDSAWFRKNYTKQESYIPMRDGIRLFTAIYTPRNHQEKHPILMIRTPYSVAPYGVDYSRIWERHYITYLRENYIIVLQDVRGCWMSEGDFVDVRPFNPDKSGKETDEASDTYDTIDWLLANTRNNNGRVGVTGISYPGFYTTMAALSGHPALKAVSPQAPVTDWFSGDDFHHNGAFMVMDAFNFYQGFGRPRPQPRKVMPPGHRFSMVDNYAFFLQHGTLSELKEMMGDSIAFWNEVYRHPDNDDFWEARNTRNFVQYIPKGVASLVTGGHFDAEDCFGAWNLYRAIEQKSENDNRLVMGPWSHGQWSKEPGDYLGNIRFGSNTSEWYVKHVEAPYFNYHLKRKGSLKDIPEATVFFTGINEWRQFPQWPPAEKRNISLYLQYTGLLNDKKITGSNSYNEYISDPQHPVSYTDGIHSSRTREYMNDDQRFAARRPDVLTYQTGVLEEDATLAGPVVADLLASVSTTDADLVVKLIDVYPESYTYDEKTYGKGSGVSYPMGGYQMLVRAEIMRGRYRNSLEHPEPFEPGLPTRVKYTLPDVAHTFKKGHRIMVQVQSSWFPLADRNPQQFINIYKARPEDFVPCRVRIYDDSRIVLPLLPSSTAQDDGAQQ